MSYDVAIRLIWAAVIAAYLIPNLAEYRLHRNNYGFLMAIGSKEHRVWLAKLYYSLSWILVPLVVAESVLLRHWPTIPSMLVATGLLFTGLMLRFWAIRALGHYWTMRCLEIPGADQVRMGPYRYLRHPEYLGRLIEGLGLCLMFHAIFVAAVYFIVNSVIWRILAHSEERMNQDASTLVQDNS